MKKICNKTYAKNKKEESIIQNNKSEIKKNSKPINSSSFSKRSSNSTKYVKFQETEKCNTYRESNEIKNKISQDESGIKNYKSKKKKKIMLYLKILIIKMK